MILENKDLIVCSAFIIGILQAVIMYFPVYFISKRLYDGIRLKMKGFKVLFWLNSTYCLISPILWFYLYLLIYLSVGQSLSYGYADRATSEADIAYVIGTAIICFSAIYLSVLSLYGIIYFIINRLVKRKRQKIDTELNPLL
jgi:hypothetical protein